MTSVNIANLKAKLSYYLAQVKQGHEILVMDRSTPVARITPSPKPEPRLTVIKAKKSPKALLDLKPLPPLKHRIDVAALLREDRDAR